MKDSLGCEIMRWIKKHITIIVIVVVILLLIGGFFLAKDIFFPDENKAIYGTRLEGREKVTISKETKNKVKELLQEGSEKVDVRVAGRIIYIHIYVTGDTPQEKAKEMGNKSLEAFSDAEKSYYDIQIMINHKENQSQYPILGYKHHTKTAIVWTKDRAAS